MKHNGGLKQWNKSNFVREPSPNIESDLGKRQNTKIPLYCILCYAIAVFSSAPSLLLLLALLLLRLSPVRLYLSWSSEILVPRARIPSLLKICGRPPMKKNDNTAVAAEMQATTRFMFP